MFTRQLKDVIAAIKSIYTRTCWNPTMINGPVKGTGIVWQPADALPGARRLFTTCAKIFTLDVLISLEEGPSMLSGNAVLSGVEVQMRAVKARVYAEQAGSRLLEWRKP